MCPNKPSVSEPGKEDCSNPSSSGILSIENAKFFSSPNWGHGGPVGAHRKVHVDFTAKGEKRGKNVF